MNKHFHCPYISLYYSTKRDWVLCRPTSVTTKGAVRQYGRLS